MNSNINREKMSYHNALKRDYNKRTCCRTCCNLCRGGRNTKNKNAKDNTLRSHRGN